MFHEKHRVIISKWLDEQDIPNVLIEIILDYFYWVLCETYVEAKSLILVPYSWGFLISVPSAESEKSLLELMPMKDWKRYQVAVSALKCRSFHCRRGSKWCLSPDCALVFCFKHGNEFRQMLED